METLTTYGTADAASAWWPQEHGDEGLLVAYFSMEFGVDARLPIYSGGLGVLAGDHLKAAAELGVPLVGVGLFYRGGYFTQGLSDEGRQTETYATLDPETLGLVREPVNVDIELAGETVSAAVWRLDIGSVPLYLLDVDYLTDALYSGDREHRIQQELLLGVGGVRALKALGLQPTVYHVNEGHSAFLTIERARDLVAGAMSTDDALDLIKRTTVFTTHTPVPAGNEVFADDLVTRYVSELATDAGITTDALLALGHSEGADGFGLTPLALRLSSHANGVSKLHGEVAREMWAPLWPGATPPIDSITNGVHLGTWLAPELAGLLLQAGVRPSSPPAWGNWEAAEALDLDALERVHEVRKRQVADIAGIDPSLLTIGFARRFATYKRAGLVFSELERLLALPVQIVVAGKAHPADAPGKDVMQQIVELSHDPSVAGRVVFLPDYNIELAQRIIPGCDVWLNTPRRPYEASGTSGMKAAVNGVLNFSVLDGWWAEAYDPAFGWAIEGASDDEDREQLYRVLEEQIVPCFADRARWLEMMRASIARLSPVFSMQRAVIEYTERFYIPQHTARHTDVQALLVTGSVGAGKTAVLLALGELLAEQGGPYALVDLDWLCWASAPDATPQELLVANLALVRGTFARAGVTRLALSRYVRTEAEVEAIRAAAGGELVVVALAAPRDVLEARLRNRDTGRELAEHLAELERVPAQLDYPVVSSAEGSPADTARRVLAAAGW